MPILWVSLSPRDILSYKEVAVFPFPNLYYVRRNRQPSFLSHKGKGEQGTGSVTQVRPLVCHRLYTPNLMMEEK